VSGSTEARGRRVLTPAVTAATAFAILAAVVSIAFVSARGGLQLPVAATPTPGIAAASTAPTASVVPAPTTEASGSPSAGPNGGPSANPPTQAPASGPPDPLAALPGCPGHPGCFEYVVRRGDSFSAVSDRYGLLLWITRALNPEVTDDRLILVGHDPTVRLDPCPDGAACHLYAVRSGDTVSTIASRYGLSVEGILALNPALDPSHIVTGQVIRLPLFAG